MEEATRRTPLADWHITHGANMVDFGGWAMPLWYPSGAKREHITVIIGAGLFDTSHMGVITMSGSGALDLLQLCFTKNLQACLGKSNAPLKDGRSVYGAFLNEDGTVIDDAIVFQLADNAYMVVVNCGMSGAIAAHLKAHQGTRDVEIDDLEGRVAKLDLQGPQSVKILMKVLKDPERVFESMPYFSFKGHFDGESPLADTLLTDGSSILLSRTGYTGEFGFELFLKPDHAAGAWEKILEAGEEFDLIACGLAARDSLRAGAGLPLSHQDIGAWPFINHPWPFALPFDDSGAGFTKKFIGDVVLSLADKAEHTQAFVGYDPRKVSIDDPAVVLDSSGNEIGVVLTCVGDLAIERENDIVYSIASPDKPEGFKPRGLCCGFVRMRSALSPGQIVQLKDNRREIKVQISKDVRPARTARRPIREFL
jgi:aminomethyltransferase